MTDRVESFLNASVDCGHQIINEPRSSLTYLGHCDWFQASLSTSSEVARHLNDVSSTAEVWVNPVSACPWRKRRWTWTETGIWTRIQRFKRLITIIHLLFTVEEVPADACRVVPGSHWVLQALDHSADVLQGLENYCTVVQKRQAHALEDWLKNTTKTLSNITFFIKVNPKSNRTTNNFWLLGLSN